MSVDQTVVSQMGQIVAAYEIQHGTALVAPTTVGLAYLEVEDLDDFADAGGELYLAAVEDLDSTSETLRYAGLDRDLNRVLLSQSWSADFLPFAAGDNVWIFPLATERRADVALDGEEDQIVICRVPYGISANIPLGVREERGGEWVRVVQTDYGYALDDATLEYPKTDPDSISIVDPDTGEEIGSIGGDASFDTVTADEIISPSVPRRNYEAKLLYIDAATGSDDNDGTAFAPLADLFERTVANGGWGTSESGHLWTVLQNQGNLVDVEAATGSGRIRVNTASQNTVLRSAFATLDNEILATVNIDTRPTAGSVLIGVAGRVVAGSDLIAANLAVSSTGTVSIWLETKIGGTWTQVVNFVLASGLSGAAIGAIDWKIRLQTQLNPEGGTDFRARAWDATGAEPESWQVETNVTAGGGIQSPNGIGAVYRTGGTYSGTIQARYRSLEAFCIDAAGNAIDTAEGGVGPLLTIARGLEEVGQWNDEIVRLILAGVFDESIEVRGLGGGGRLYVDGGNATTLYGLLDLFGIAHFLQISNLVVQDTGDAGGAGTATIGDARHVELTGVKFQTNSARAYNVQAYEGASVRVADCQLSGATSYCLQIQENAVANAVDNSGSAGVGSYRTSQAILFVDGTKPTGATSETLGGLLRGTNTTSGGGTPPPTSTKVTKTYAPNASRTWRPEWGWREDNDETYQGEYAGSGGLSRGAAFHGTKLNVAGKNADSGKIFVKRLNSGGGSGAVGIYLASHDLASQPGNDSTKPVIMDGPTKIGELAWGQGKWMTIPVGWVQSMLNGSGGRRGFMLYNGSASPYVIAHGAKSGGDVWKVKFTFH